MLQAIKTFLNRPVAEDFSFKNQLWQSLQNGLYVFLLIYFLGGSSFTGHVKVLILALFGAGCAVSALVANWVVPSLFPTLYNEDRWTVWKHSLQTLFVLFCVSVGNQVLLMLTYNEYPPFWQMYLIVTLIGFFPILMSVFVTEQRRLKRNLAQAQTLNAQLSQRFQSVLTAPVPDFPGLTEPVPIAHASKLVLSSESGRERLSLQPDQLLYIESVGNYIEVHWLDAGQLQKTVLRSTLKEMTDVLTRYPQFFRCHRAFLVNLKAVSLTEGNARGYQLTLNGIIEKIPVSRSYLDAFDERLAALN